MPEDAGCRFGGAIRIGGLLWRTVAFWLKRPAGGCRCIGRGSVLSCAGGAKRYFKASSRPGDGHGAGKRRPGREAAEPQRRASEQGSMSLPCREVWSLSVRCRSPPKRKFRARFLLKEPCPEFLRFSGFYARSGPAQECASDPEASVRKTYLLRSGRRLRTVAPACHISLSRISLSSASSFSR